MTRSCGSSARTASVNHAAVNRGMSRRGKRPCRAWPRPAHPRVLIANEKRDRLELLAQVVAGLGHEVIARDIYVKEVGAVAAREQPDVALVGPD